MHIFRVIVFMFLFSIYGNLFGFEVKNSNTPSKGTWDFKMQYVWSVSEAGENLFSIIDDFKCADNGTLYVMDRKLFTIYCFDQEGKFLTSFGKRGIGPGEFSTLRSLYLLKDVLIIVDDLNIHYYSLNGKYIKSFPNQHINLSPVSFINPDKFISVTTFAGADNSSDMGSVAINDIKNKKKIDLFQFPKWKQGVITVQKIEGNMTSTTNYSYSASLLTPGMILFSQKGKLYFGMNNEYLIKVMDLNGKEIFHFSLDREKIKASSALKDKIANGFNLPDDIKKQIRKKLPDELNFFDEIYVDEKGFIYICANGSGEDNIKNIDIFSNTGKYIYKSNVFVDKKYSIKNLYFKGNVMYANLLLDGDELIGKYKIQLPK